MRLVGSSFVSTTSISGVQTRVDEEEEDGLEINDKLQFDRGNSKSVARIEILTIASCMLRHPKI